MFLDKYINNKELLYNFNKKIILKKEYKSCYYTLTDLENIYSINFLNILKSKYKYFNEIILKNSRRKIYLDFDLNIPYFHGIAELEFKILVDIDKYLRKYLDSYNINNKYNISYCRASRREEDDYKISLHIIVNNFGVFTFNNKLQIFIENFIKTLPPYISNGIDINVYHSIQNFRCIYSKSHKSPDATLIPIKIINNTFTEINLDEIKPSAYFVIDYFNQEKEIDHIVEIKDISNNYIKKNFNQNINQEIRINNKIKINIENKSFIKDIFKIRSKKLNIISLERLKSAECIICKRIHERDNSYIKISGNENYYFHCYKEEKGFKGILLNDIKEISKIKQHISQPDISFSRSFKRIYDKYINYNKNNNKSKNAEIILNKFKSAKLNFELNKKFSNNIYLERINKYILIAGEDFVKNSNITPFNIFDLSSKSFSVFISLFKNVS